MVTVSLKEQLRRTDERPNGFNYLRIGLSLGIICWHSHGITTGDDSAFWMSWWRAPIAIMLPMFFALSGFLVTGSLERSKTLFSFLGLRVLRIVPALAGEVLLSAFILGMIFTAYPLRQYFTDPLFVHYFWNLVGHVQFFLPGVFENNPLRSYVNGQLWTVPYELVCYISLAILAVVGLVKWRVALLWLAVFYHVGAIISVFLWPSPAVGHYRGMLLIVAFLIGVLFYRYRDHIPFSRSLFWFSVAVSMAFLSINSLDRLAVVPITYMTVFLGLTNPRPNKLILSGDYSYGLYLYGWPLQQAFSALAPSYRYWYLNILFTVPCASLAAVCSWWVIERPALSLRPYLKELEARYILARSSMITIFSRSLLLFRGSRNYEYLLRIVMKKGS